MNSQTPPPGGDRNRGPTTIAVHWTFFGVALAVYSMRMYVRTRIHAISWDDWVMGVAVSLHLGLTIVVTEIMLAGGNRHVYYLTLDKGPYGVIIVTRLWYIAQPFVFMSVAVARTSVALLILRIISLSKWRRAFLYFSIVSTLIINVLASILTFTSCSPLEALWNKLLRGHCWKTSVIYNLYIFTFAWNVFTDVCLALLPITIFWNLKLSLKKRVGLCILMSMGIFAGISAAVKTSMLSEIFHDDFTWMTYDLLFWNVLETFLIIVSGCSPTLKPLYEQLFTRRRQGKTGNVVFAASHRRSYPPKTPNFSISNTGLESHLTKPSDEISQSSISHHEAAYQMQVLYRSDDASHPDYAQVKNDSSSAEHYSTTLVHDGV